MKAMNNCNAVLSSDEILFLFKKKRGGEGREEEREAGYMHTKPNQQQKSWEAAE